MSQIIHLAQVESTNDEIMRRALAGAADGLWVQADRQTQGRGRRGRAWVSPPAGNLYASTLVRPKQNGPPLQQLSFVAALALVDCLIDYAPEIKLKWPNDALLGTRKLAGILLEAGQGPRNDKWVVVGIGINLNTHPADVERPAIDLASATGFRLTPQEVVASLAEKFSARRLLWEREGFAALRGDWLSRATGLGEAIEVRLGQETLFGRFVGLDTDGALLLDQGDIGTRAVHAGEIFGI